jgi:acyl-coenzyme A thioesterase PaaI-like protein
MKEKSQDSSLMSTSDFMRTFLEQNQPPKEAIEHFKSVPWLDRYFSSGAYKIIPTFSRHLKSSGEDYFFSRTINTPSTIPHFISLQLKDFKTPDPVDVQPQDVSVPSHKALTKAPENPDVVMMLKLGENGVDGHPSVIHGGVTCAILDESMGILIMLHDNNVRGPGPRDSLFTANLNVTYRAPVPTPGEVLVKTWLVRRQGRKWYSKGQITDRHGNTLAEADGLWVTTKRQRL